MGKPCTESFLEHRCLSKLTFSPEGSHGAFLLTKCNKRRNAYDHDLWVYDHGDEKARALTIGEGVEEFMFLSEDTVLYPKKQPAPGEENREITKFYALNVVTGEMREHFRTHKSISLHEKVTENVFIASSVYRMGMKDSLDDSCEIIEEAPFWNEEWGFFGGMRRKLCLYLIKEDRLVSISPSGFDVKGFVYDAHRRRLHYHGSHYNSLEPFASEVRSYDYTKKQDNRILEAKDYWIREIVITSEGLVMLASGRKQEGGLKGSQLYVLKLSDKSVRPLFSQGAETALGISLLTDCGSLSGRNLAARGSDLYFSGESDGVKELYYCRLERGAEPSPSKVTSLSGSVEDFTIKENTLIIAAMEEMKLPELFRLDQSGLSKISAINTRIYGEGELIQPEPFSFINFGGVNIKGWVLKPSDWEPGGRYPAILAAHNGQEMPYGNLVNHQMQLLAQNGYFVMYLNPRTSQDEKGRRAEIDFEDAMAFVTAVCDRYREIDEERLGITGQGYGGFLANWTIAQSTRFKAAVTEDGSANHLMNCDMWETSGGTREHSFLSSPFGKAEKLWYQSPIRYANQMKTPVLFLQGEEDAPWKLSDTAQLFTALKMQNVESRFCLFRGDKGNIFRFGKPENRLRRLQEIIDWFDRHLK